MGASGEKDVEQRVRDVLTDAADALEAALVPLGVNEHQSVVVADLPLCGRRAIPVAETLGEDVAAHEEGARVTDVGPESPLAQTLRDLGEPCVGALVDMGYLAGRGAPSWCCGPTARNPWTRSSTGFFSALPRTSATSTAARPSAPRTSAYPRHCSAA